MNFESGKINLSPGKVLEKSWKFFSETGYEPCRKLTMDSLKRESVWKTIRFSSQEIIKLRAAKHHRIPAPLV